MTCLGGVGRRSSALRRYTATRWPISCHHRIASTRSLSARRERNAHPASSAPSRLSQPDLRRPSTPWRHRARALVTLTITEKGYDLTEEDLAHPERSSSALALVTRALAQCRGSGRTAPLIASLDNVMGNGVLLRARVTEIAERLSPSLPGWIAEEVHFPSSVVDRMVPATTAQDVERISEQLGLVDLGAVTSERYRSWVMTEEEALLPFSEVGVDIVEDIVPFEQRKLWLLNGPHSALAYCGILAGCTTIAEASRHPMVSVFVRRLVDDVLEVAELPTSLQPNGLCGRGLGALREPESRPHLCKGRRRRVPQAAAAFRVNCDHPWAGGTRHHEVRNGRRALDRVGQRPHHRRCRIAAVDDPASTRSAGGRGQW